MVSPSDSMTLKQWLNCQDSPHTRSCYRRDADRLLAFVKKPLKHIDLRQLQDFADSLVAAGLAPVFAPAHAGGREEPVRILRADAEPAIESGAGIGAPEAR